MKQLALTDIIGRRFENEGHWGVVTHFDPISETFTFDGYNKEVNDPCVWWRTDLREYDIDFVPTEAERKMITEAKLTNQVRENAERLQKAMTDWLNAGSVGRGS